MNPAAPSVFELNAAAVTFSTVLTNPTTTHSYLPLCSLPYYCYFALAFAPHVVNIRCNNSPHSISERKRFVEYFAGFFLEVHCRRLRTSLRSRNLMAMTLKETIF